MKRTWCLVVAVLFAAALHSGCAMLTGKTAGEIVDDSTITAEVNAIIVKDPELQYLKIDVDTTEGNVVLAGFVPNKGVEDRLVERVKQIRGVKSVKSLLKIEERK